jgi:hypothetical protein
MEHPVSPACILPFAQQKFIVFAQNQVHANHHFKSFGGRNGH